MILRRPLLNIVINFKTLNICSEIGELRLTLSVSQDNKVSIGPVNSNCLRSRHFDRQVNAVSRLKYPLIKFSPNQWVFYGEEEQTIAKLKPVVSFDIVVSSASNFSHSARERNHRRLHQNYTTLIR